MIDDLVIIDGIIRETDGLFGILTGILKKFLWSSYNCIKAISTNRILCIEIQKALSKLLYSLSGS